MGDFLQSCVFYKKAGCHTIARYIGAKSDPTKVLWELNWYQQDIRDQQTKIRRYKRDTVVLNKMSSVPQTPANLKRWADKHIMPHYLFYDYNNGRVKTQVYCTYCEKFSVIKRPKNNDVLRCPKCDQKVIAKAQGRRAAYYEDRETCQVVQQISPHELVVRIYKLYWSYVKGKDTTRKSAYNPYMGAALAEKFEIATDVRYFVVSKQLIFYRVDGENDTVEILRVLDGRTDYLSVLFG